jgi:5S rRNA maturation endonuclease (ribonuclease M5)
MNILGYVKSKGLRPVFAARTNGGEYKGPCLMCGGKDRCAYWPDKDGFQDKGGGFYCRGCGQSGDLVELIKIFERVNYKEACEICGIVPKTKQISYGKNQNLYKNTKVAATKNGPIWQDKAQEFINLSHEKLLKSPQIIDWLNQKKSISIDSIRLFKIGWNPETLYEKSFEWGLNNSNHNKVVLPKGLVLPRFDANKKLTGIKVRCNENSSMRYCAVTGSSSALAFYGKIRENLIIVESELDAIFLHELYEGNLASISTGSAAKNSANASSNNILKSENILICLDSDCAGKKYLKKWLEGFPQAKSWLIPSSFGKDPTEAYLNGFPVKKWLNLGFNTIKKKKVLNINPLIKLAVRIESMAQRKSRKDVIGNIKEALAKIDKPDLNKQELLTACDFLKETTEKALADLAA